MVPVASPTPVQVLLSVDVHPSTKVLPVPKLAFVNSAAPVVFLHFTLVPDMDSHFLSPPLLVAVTGFTAVGSGKILVVSAVATAVSAVSASRVVSPVSASRVVSVVVVGLVCFMVGSPLLNAARRGACGPAPCLLRFTCCCLLPLVHQ
jgi:hypothetical protein